MKSSTSLSLIAFGLWLLATACGNNKNNENFQIKGKLRNSSGETISLVNVNGKSLKAIDSAKINEEGEFIFTAKVPEKGFYSLQISPSNFTTLIIDSTEKVILEGNAKYLNDSIKVTGSPDSELFFQFDEMTRDKLKEIGKIRNQRDSVQRVFEVYANASKDRLRIDSLSKALEPQFNAFSAEYAKQADELSDYAKKFIDEHSNSFAAFAAIRMLNRDRDISYFAKVSDALSAKYPNIENLKEFKQFVDQEKKLAIGAPAPEITLNDRNEMPLSLSSLKGKVVLVDFWASWCKPCRQANPFAVDLYKRYKDKGFDIFSVSLDQKKDAWLQAINADKLTWKNHVCDFKMWESPVVELYGFKTRGIPFTCLLDKNGNIAGKNLQGPVLEDKIKELLAVTP